MDEFPQRMKRAREPKPSPNLKATVRILKGIEFGMCRKSGSILTVNSSYKELWGYRLHWKCRRWNHDNLNVLTNSTIAT